MTCKWSKPPKGFDLPAAENFNLTLKETASSYLDLGWPIVPLWGDTKPEQAKVAAIPWSTFQRRRPTHADVQRWFTDARYTGLGIVVGAVSGLAVLDFDSLDLITAFERELPALAATRTVLTRRGKHFYFCIPPHLRVASRKLTSVDLLSDGHYVVAPPTIINGHHYTIGQGGIPRTLSADDLRRLNAFLDRYARHSPVEVSTRPITHSGSSLAIPGGKAQERAFSCEDKSPLVRLASTTPDAPVFLTADALVMFYRSLVRQSGRNSALFKTTCLARDHGWRFEAVVAVLAGTHADEPAHGRHPNENRKARHREAVCTIRSAFSQPSRPPQKKDTGGLFNSVREKLMQLGQTCVVRVLEGLRLAGLKPGQLVSERFVLQLLKGLVGRHSIRLALNAKTPTNVPIFDQISPRYPPQRYAAAQIRIDRQTNAYVNEKKTDSFRGRQERHFRIPSAAALCEHLAVAPSGSDPMVLEDLRTAKRARQALHRGLLERRPGTYLRKWLADRLGVSERTLTTYNRSTAGIQVVPTFTQTPIRWHNLNAIPAPSVALPGTCLEDSTGKLWPAIKGVAQKLLAQGRGVRLLVRSLNYYWGGPGDPPVSPGLQVQRSLDLQPNTDNVGASVVSFAQRVARLVRSMGVVQPPEEQSTAAAHNGYGTGIQAGSDVAVDYTQTSPVDQRRKRKSSVDHEDERLAERLYEIVNGQTPDANRRISHATARKWVALYGQVQVKASLEILQQRRGVQAPAAFLFTLLRSSQRYSAP